MTIKELAELLMQKDNYEILTHNYPDGDCLGCGYGLCLALQQIGKKARVITTTLPSKFEYLLRGVKQQKFNAQFVISTDVADESLLGCNREKYEGKIDLCIDHHKSNTVDSPLKYVDGTAAAASEIIYELIKQMGATVTKEIADCLYTGVSTDTGCFCYTNTTSTTLRIAADLLDYGCDSEHINKVMFETKSKSRIDLERRIYDSMIFCCEQRCAIIYVTLAMTEQFGDDEMEGLSSIPRQIEGVKMGITVREKPDGIYKISVRTNDGIDACGFCKQFGGGGHAAAAGCSIKGTLNSVMNTMMESASEYLCKEY